MGEDQAIGTYRGVARSEDALDATLAYLADTLQRARVLTPDPLINDGALWSKVNMRRVMARYPQGPSFTNEPGVSSNVVGRDVAWFVYGNDHFMPDFSREILDAFARLQYPDGKIAEYYNALDGRVDDYGLNINDDTPLFVLAVNHHFRATGNVEWLRRIYPAVARAARYIVSQLDGRGLVSCSARDPRGNVWAIAGWRNVIPNYTLNGAVTEINAECVAALRAAGHLAADAGRDEAEAAGFRDAAARLREAMDAHLRNPENGLYYLNIDADGHAHTDVTGDQIFPVMFRACDEETGFAIISRLNSPDFWTAAGLRTASRHDPLYDPSANVGLIGGVWPGLTWWYAFAAARYHPEFMVEALSSSFAHYAADPRTNNTVPGQFGEWFDGESLINRGMRLSPWEPPRFLWAAVEGVCGLMLTTGRPSVNPLVPAAWKWVALRRLPYHGAGDHLLRRPPGRRVPPLRQHRARHRPRQRALRRGCLGAGAYRRHIGAGRGPAPRGGDRRADRERGHADERRSRHPTAAYRQRHQLRCAHLQQRARRMGAPAEGHGRGLVHARALHRVARLPYYRAPIPTHGERGHVLRTRVKSRRCPRCG